MQHSSQPHIGPFIQTIFINCKRLRRQHCSLWHTTSYILPIEKWSIYGYSVSCSSSQPPVLANLLPSAPWGFYHFCSHEKLNRSLLPLFIEHQDDDRSIPTTQSFTGHRSISVTLNTSSVVTPQEHIKFTTSPLICWIFDLCNFPKCIIENVLSWLHLLQQ